MQQQGRGLPVSGLLHLSVVYVVWSSTYLAIRVAVRADSGFPPFIMCASRMALASLMFLALSCLRRDRLAPRRQEWPQLIVTALLLWLGGNGLVIWAEQTANSGLTALMVSTTPIWVAIFELAIFRKAPTPRLMGALLLGFAGLGVLMTPALRRGNLADLTSGLALVGASISWALGSVYQNRHPVRLSSTATAAYQNLVACVAFGAVSLLMREPHPTPTPHAWAAWLYLVVFGGLAFVSFVTTLKVLPISIAMTYAYVNPVLAVALGWWILGEPVTRWTVGGAVMVIASVVAIFHERYRVKRAA